MSRSGVCGVETGARMRCLRSRAATESGALRRSDETAATPSAHAAHTAATPAGAARMHRIEAGPMAPSEAAQWVHAEVVCTTQLRQPAPHAALPLPSSTPHLERAPPT